MRVAVDPGSWLIATGRDSKGRAVSMRSAEFDAGQLRKKFERQRAFNKALPGLMAQIERDAAAGNEAASVLRLIAHTGFRVGGKGDGRAAVEAFGASTLKAEHVFINGDTVSFSFAGKKGVRQEHSIVDATLARDLSARMDRPQLFATTDQKVRDYLHSLDGGADYKVHDFRTWNATEAARQAIAAIPTPTDPASFWAAYDLVGDAAAAKIGDTRAVALESYVDPTVFTEWRIATGVEEGSARPNRGRKAANDAAAAGADAGVPGDTPLPAAPEGGSLEQGAAESGPSLFHGEQDPRAQISLPQSFDLGPAVITLLAGADRSSFIHESGHLFLEVHLDVAGKIQRQINAGASVSEGERGIVEDVRKLLSWFGITDTPEQSALDRWASLSFEERRPLHEQFARGFEAYAFEGKAPSIELRGVFRQFASWLKQIYRTLRGLDVELTADVRGVMDRMLASDEAIAEAEALRAMGPLFRSAEQAGMTLKEFEAYQALGKKPTDEAIEDLQTRTLRDMRWVSRARERALTEREKEVEAIRRETRMRVRAEVYGEPVYAAWQFLTGKDVEDVGEHGKLNANVLREMYGTDETAIWRKLSALRMTNETGLDPEVVAERFDFDSGDALVKALADAVPPNEVIEARTDERMLEEHGDITSPEALARAADEAVFNDARARFVAAEVKALRDAMKLRTGPRATVDALARAARDFAAQIIGRQRVRDLRPGQYAAAAARSARLAQASFGADKVDEAAMHKRNQLVNTYAAKAAVAAKQEVEKALRYLRKFDGEVSGLEQEYHDQIDQLLEGLDLRTPSNREADRRRSLSEWVAEQQALGMVPSLSPELMAQVGRKSYRDMTLDELREVVDSVKEIEHLGRLKNRLLTAASKRDFDSTVADMVGSIVQHGGKPREVKLEGQDRGLRYWAESFAAQHRKLASLFRQMDGNNDAGPLWENIGRPMNERGTREEGMIEQATERLQALYAPLLGMQGGITGARSKVFIPEIGASLTRGGRLAVALNWGNEINRERMRADPVGKWTDEKVRAVFRTLTAEELAFVNGAWEFLDSYWPEVADKQRRVTGTAPEKVEASAFVAVGAGGIEVPMRGGYYPLKYQDVRAEQQEAVQTAKDMARGAMANATTRRGHTKERLQNVKRNLRLDLDVITQHTNEVIHDLVWHEWLIDVNRIVKDERVAAAVETHYGRQVLQTIRNDIDGIAAGDLTRQTAVDKALLTLRGNISRATMGFSVTTALLQPFGLTQSMYRIGAKWVLKGGARWAGDAVRFESTARWVNEKSDFMRLRGKTMNRELREIAQRVGGKSKPAQVWDAALFYFMRKAQLIADIPTWVGQYEKTLAEGPKTNDEAGRAELEARAVAMADRAVLESQGGGQMKDLAEVQRKHPMLTQFYSYFSTTLNLAVESTAATNFKSPAAVVGWVGDMMLLLVIPAILPAMLTYALKGGGGDDDEASMLKRALKWQAGYMLGLLVGMRETSGLIEGFDYSGPPVGRVVSLAGRAGKQTAQGEIDEPLVLAYANLIGTAFGIPMVQLTRMYKGWKAWHEGDPRASAASVLMGPPPKD
ncbi:MAG TPA: hypothetical protein DCZ11_08655 [Gammaproteobacteria bacterium]|nr:hypothetical protein [Gammaproteobacteria bacterium]MCH78501.1 hypothetical protein [Gammaproteobacteria bacterium]